jgi:hypothetical protein
MTKKDDAPLTNREMPIENNNLIHKIKQNARLRQFIVVISFGLFIGYMMPFGMDELSVTQSIAYWVFTCICGYLIFMPVIHLGHKYLSKHISAAWQRVAASSLIASIVMSFIVPFINWLFFNSQLELISNLLHTLPKSLIIGSIITFFSLLQNHIKQQKEQLLHTRMQIEEQAQNTSLSVQQINQFMSLLPLEKRGQLLCLEMDDHYLKVHTDKGQHMLLMRLKDALAQLEGFNGLQTHRSWWVATDAVAKVNKENRKISLLLTNQIEVPVSRTFIEAVKAANII